jgi:hypothetical protein
LVAIGLGKSLFYRSVNFVTEKEISVTGDLPSLRYRAVAQWFLFAITWARV